MLINPEEVLAITKITAYFFGDKTIEVTKIDKKVACEALKKMADNKSDWTRQQKESYKQLVEYLEQCVEQDGI